MFLQYLVNLCVSLGLYKYMWCYHRITVNDTCSSSSMQQPEWKGDIMCFSSLSKAVFLCHNATQAVRNLALSCCHANPKHLYGCFRCWQQWKFKWNNVFINSLFFWASCFCIVAESVCTGRCKWNTSKTFNHHLLCVKLSHKVSKSLLLDWNIVMSVKWTHNMGLLLHW